LTKLSKISKKFSGKQWVKCYRCDKKFNYKHIKYVLRIPEQRKYAAICEECYKKRKGNARKVIDLPVSDLIREKLKFRNILDLP